MIWRVAFWASFWAIAIIVTAVLLAAPVLSHDFYDYDCCSDRDCEPIPPEYVKATDAGWEILAVPMREYGKTVGWRALETPYLVPYGKARVSVDSAFHGCFSDAGVMIDPSAVTACLYVPPQGF